MIRVDANVSCDSQGLFNDALGRQTISMIYQRSGRCQGISPAGADSHDVIIGLDDIAAAAD